MARKESGKTRPGSKLYRQIVDYIQYEACTLLGTKELAEALGCSKGYISTVMRLESIILPSERHRKAEAIKRTLAEGERSLEVLCNLIGSKQVMDICSEWSVELPDDLIPYRYKPKLDSMIDDGMSLPQIEKVLGINRMTISNYIRDSGQYKYWREKRNQVNQCRIIISNKEDDLDDKRKSLLDVIHAMRNKRIAGRSWAHAKAIEYRKRWPRRTSSIPFTKLLAVFEDCEAVESAGEKVILRQLAERHDMWVCAISRMLNSVGLEHLHRPHKKRTLLTPEQNEAIERAYHLNFASHDIAYFLSLQYHVVSTRWRRIAKESRKKRQHPKPIYLSSDKTKLTYRLASDIYYAKDNFPDASKDEIADVCFTSPEIVKVALRRRKSISKKIINALEVLYPEEHITKPYLA